MHKQILLISLLAELAFGQTLPDINRNTQGTLNINRGGTGATSAASALSNLGGISATSTDSLSNKTLINPKINAILDPSNGSVVLQIQSTTGATEGITFTPATSGNAPEIASFGSGSNVDLLLNPKGSGLLQLPIAAQINIADGTLGYMLTKGVTGLVWAPVGSGGTVQSVNVTGVSGFFTFSGGPVTTTGTIGMSLDSQAANLVFASPNASPGSPVFRSLVSNDIPNLDAGKVTSGLFATARIVNGGAVANRCLEMDAGGVISAASAACNTSSSGVTSVGVSGISGVLSVSGSPVTSAGTIALSLDTQTANKFLASPSGGSGTPSMRIIAAADIPVLDTSKITTGTFGTSRVVTGTLTSGACLGLDGSLNIVGQSTGCGTVTADTGTLSGYVATWTATDRKLGPGIQYGAGSLASTLMYRNAANQTAVSTLYVDSVIFSGTAAIVNTLTADVPGLDITAYSGQTLPLVRFYGPGGTPLLSYIDSLGRFPATSLVGLVPAANLGSGTANSTTVLYGDGVYRSAPGGGNVVVTGATSAGYVPRWLNTSGELTTGSYQVQTTTPIANSLMGTDSYGASVSYDKGGAEYNVKAYGAVGDDSTDDRAAIQAAIDGTPAYGGIVRLPVGSFRINSTHPSYSGCGIVIGNGSSAGYSTQNAITLQGSGGGVGADVSGDTNANRGATRIKGTSGSITNLVCFRGPVANVWLKDILLDGNDQVGQAIDWLHTTESGISRVKFVKFTTRYIDMSSVTKDGTGNWGFYNCGNHLSDFTMSMPTNSTTNGIRVTGVYDSGTSPSPTYHTSCSNLFSRFGIGFGGGSSAVGIELAYADNNKFEYGGVNSYSGSSPGSGKPINFIQQSDGAVGSYFPYGNKFTAIDSNHGQIYYGTSGSQGNSVWMHTNQEGNAMPNLAKLYVFADDGRGVLNAGQLDSKSIDARDINNTTIWAITRDFGTGKIGDGNGTQFQSFGALYIENPEGTRVSSPRTFAGLPTSPVDGIQVYCSNCTIANPCASGGTGAIAKRLNSTWVCN